MRKMTDFNVTSQNSQVGGKIKSTSNSSIGSEMAKKTNNQTNKQPP